MNLFPGGCNCTTPLHNNTYYRSLLFATTFVSFSFSVVFHYHPDGRHRVQWSPVLLLSLLCAPDTIAIHYSRFVVGMCRPGQKIRSTRKCNKAIKMSSSVCDSVFPSFDVVDQPMRRLYERDRLGSDPVSLSLLYIIRSLSSAGHNVTLVLSLTFHYYY